MFKKVIKLKLQNINRKDEETEISLSLVDLDNYIQKKIGSYNVVKISLLDKNGRIKSSIKC